MQILIDSGGTARCVYDETIDLATLGKLTIRRGSLVEPDEHGGWSADLAPVGGPVLGPFATRSQALVAEAAWLERNWLVASDDRLSVKRVKIGEGWRQNAYQFSPVSQTRQDRRRLASKRLSVKRLSVKTPISIKLLSAGRLAAHNRKDTQPDEKDNTLMMHTRLNDARVFVRGFAYGSVAPLAMGIVCLVGTSTANADDERPNIILAMTDDQGWAETGYNGHPSLKTPVLDEMAAQGLRFDRSYSGDPVCSPTRASVMTGRAPVRSGVLHWNYALRPEELTVAEILQAAGYRTGHFGKWHLGPVKKTSPSNPARHGFDEYLSHDNFFDLDPPLSRNGDPPTVHRGESSEIIVDAAIEFILKAKQEKKPFFTVIWFGSPHGPYHGTKKDLEIYSEVQDETLRNRFAEITAMDRALGTLRKALDKADVRENTLLWFCGDNGVPANVAPRDSLRGGKGQMFEGGLRVPGILEWPAGIRKPAQSGVPCVTSDILPTVLDIAGIAYPADRPLDGISLRSVLDGRMTKRPSPIGFWKHELSWPPREQKTAETEPWFGNPSALLGTTPNGRGEVHQFANIKYLHPRTSGFGGSFAWIDNDWKLVSPGRGTVLLFNVAHDPRETHDLAKQDPERVVRMRAALTTWQASVEKSLSGADYGEGEGGDP